MDYKELIDKLREDSMYHKNNSNDAKAKYFELIAFAMETLLVERNAAIREQQTILGGTYVSIEWFKAVQAELDALKAKQPAKLDRSRWKGCWNCNNPKVRELGLRHGREYCPCCGKPLTGKAWAELERRINDGTAD